MYLEIFNRHYCLTEEVKYCKIDSGNTNEAPIQDILVKKTDYGREKNKRGRLRKTASLC